MIEQQKRVCILMGSPKQHGNTAALAAPMAEYFRGKGAIVDYIVLSDKKLSGCKDCRACQEIAGEAGCAIKDDMTEIYPMILKADLIVFATPIHTWAAALPMKAVMDRMFALSKYYGKTIKEQLLLSGKQFAMLATCGDGPGKGSDLLNIAFERLADYAGAQYLGELTIRDIHGKRDFETPEAFAKVTAFADRLLAEEQL